MRFSLIENLAHMFFCAKNRKKVEYFKKGIKSVERTLDLETIIKQLRQLRDVSNLLLTRNQRFFLPQLKSNVMREKNTKYDDPSSASSEEEYTFNEKICKDELKKLLRS